jgi:hypothetical protein
MLLRLLALSAALSLACGGDDDSSGSSPDGAPGSSPDATSEDPDAGLPALTCDEADLAGSLETVPGVASAIETDCGDFVVGPARCFAVSMEQPIDHGAPDGALFAQRLFLTHRGCDQPTVVADWGYSNEYFYDDELSVLFQSNALWIEHRYQGQSIPAPADWDWTALTIENGATDMHRVVAGFRRLYQGRWVSTGASKGGITATYHSYFFPGDLDGAIPYVAPASRARIDPAYQDYLDTALPTTCANRIRNAQVAALTTRREMMLSRLTEFSGPGGEAQLLDDLTAYLDWSFWQYWGVTYCDQVPRASATNNQFWQFYLDFSYLSFFFAAPGEDPEMSYGALYYEWLTEQGFALQLGDHVAELIESPSTRATMEETFLVMFPGVVLPAYDGTVTAAARAWARDEAEDLLLIYGQYDPWSGGALEPPARSTSGRYFVPGATHAAQIMALPEPDQSEALAHAARMFGREPDLGLLPAARRAGEIRHAITARHAERATTAALRLRLRR